MYINHIVICDLPDSTTLFLYYFTNKNFFEKKKNIENKMCVLIFFTTLSETLLIIKNWTKYDKKMYIGLYVKYRYTPQILMRLAFSLQIFEKYSNIKIHEKESRENRLIVHGQTEKGRTDRQTWRSL